MQLVEISRRLSRAVGALRFAPPVTTVYNPLEYAREPHERYLERFGRVRRGERRPVLLLGMNPGPFGMAQTGVPFGEVARVRDFLGIEGRVAQPSTPHPKRPVQGFACARSEVSGARLWGWVQARFHTPEAFFERAFVVNYCPLVFMEESGRNFTPDKLPVEEREALFTVCDEALRECVAALKPDWVVGVGAFARRRAELALAERLSAGALQVGSVLHPSPASPKANRGWGEAADAELAAQGITALTP
ncbi:MAG: single-stranded DNA-binding protein [Polyangiaceae bacterium]|nr:single-stranded DNA-binding protein [Polyangiaceae bacterium]MCW5792614.1 single-stranded DNA-binding protein [Polyangiaceae bacterium]